MKKWIGLMALTTAAAATASSALAASFYEPFNEPLGSLNNVTSPNGHLWYETSTTGGGPTANIISGNMNIPGLAPAQGNELDWGNLSATVGIDGIADRVDIGGYSSGTLYFSMAFNVPDLTGFNSTYTKGGLIAAFSNSDGAGTIGTAAFKLYLRQDPNDPTDYYNLGATVNQGNTSSDWATANGSPSASNWLQLIPGETYFVVGEYVEGGTGTNTANATMNLWINPDMSTFGTNNQPTPNASYAYLDDNPGFTGYQVASFALRQSQYAAADMIADELRIGNSYSSVTGVQWTGAGDGTTWGATGNWSSGTVPGGQGADVTFDNTAAGGHNIILDSAQTIGTIRLNGDSNYTIGGTNQLEFDTAVNGDLNIGTATGGGASGPNDAAYIHNAANPAQIIVTPNAGNVTDTISAPVYLNRSTNLTVPTGSTLNLTGGVSVNTETTVGVFLTLNGGGNAVITPTSSSALTNPSTGHGLTGLEVAGNLKINPAHAPVLVTTQAPTLTSSDSMVHQNTVTAFNVSAGSTLDLTNNDLIVDYAPNAIDSTDTDTTTGPAVVADVEASYDHGAWDLPGITTSVATPGTALAVVDNAELQTPLTSVDGIAIDTSTVIAKYTWYGDLNLDGVVNNADLLLMGDNDLGWGGGDLNYDGVVNLDDFSLFALGVAMSNGANIVPVPEPSAALMLIGLGAIAARRRRVL